MSEGAEIYRFHAGEIPLLVSIPHAGTHIPPHIAARLTGQARACPDTDFFVDRLYSFVPALGASAIAATHSRFVVDLNRPPDDASLYPGRFTTGLLPAQTLDGGAVYRKGAEPDGDDTALRLERYWRPYHDKIARELSRLKQQFGYALLWDAHSIKSRIPALFDGELPVYNFGTHDGKACALPVEPAFADVLKSHGVDSFVFNGRFKGGYITRHYGKPEQGVHALQLELVQDAYMDERTNRYDEEKAEATAAVIRDLMAAFAALEP